MSIENTTPWQFVCKTDDGDLPALKRECEANGMNVICDDQGQFEAAIWTWFNPLTDSEFVATLYAIKEDDGTLSICTEMRDHDGDGPMIEHDISVVYKSSYYIGEDEVHAETTQYCVGEFIICCCDYRFQQNKRYDDLLTIQCGYPRSMEADKAFIKAL